VLPSMRSREEMAARPTISRRSSWNHAGSSAALLA
jgi:hypothetical protein